MLAATIQLLPFIPESSQTWFLISVHYCAGKYYFDQVLEIVIYNFISIFFTFRVSETSFLLWKKTEIEWTEAHGCYKNAF